ncbi:hypothetical protein F4677DRAFT_458320 [Hypoxylon crocopeplum]|nr:hypothetical protein F4677DRAFT_458320 [Hypoxylon crocopeplum]
MAHSPLLRTVMRLKLDSRSVALVSYELALEDVSIDLQQPPNKKNFDESRWADLRKAHENKKTRQAQQTLNEQGYVTTIIKQRRTKESRSRQCINLHRAWEEVVPTKSKALSLNLARSGYGEWRPPLLSDCLLFDQSSLAPPSYGHVCVADIGILDRRLLHHAISPKYVPKPHFKMERKRLEAKSAEFAAFVAAHMDLMPRPQDESSDEGLLTMSEQEDSTDENISSNELGRAKTRPKKRKRAATAKSKKRRRKPPNFIKLYDCKAHDRAHLKAEAINRFSFMQQRLPRVEFPPWERLIRGFNSWNSKSPVAMDIAMDIDIDEDPAVQEVKTYGIILPVRLPDGEIADEEEQELTFEDASQYRTWRSQVRPYFYERDRYMQSRVYQERVYDRELLQAAQSLMGFWAKVAA